MSNLIDKLKALTNHIEAADVASVPVNVVHLARELVDVTHDVIAILQAVGAIEKPETPETVLMGAEGSQPGA